MRGKVREQYVFVWKEKKRIQNKIRGRERGGQRRRDIFENCVVEGSGVGGGRHGKTG